MGSVRYIPLEQLSPSLLRRAEEYLRQTGVVGDLVGAFVGEIAWDVRPVIEYAGARDIVRFLGPFDRLPPEMAESTQEYFVKIHHKTPRLECGISEGTLWTKREYAPGTFADHELLQAYLASKGVKGFLLELLKLIRNLHESGIIHGHISAGNIYASKNGELRLLDHGAALFSPASYSQGNASVIAPELRSSPVPRPTTAVDVYSFGRFLKSEFPSLYLWHESFFRRALSEKPSERPSALEIQDYVFESMRFLPVLWIKNLFYRLKKILTTEIHYEKEKKNIPFYLAILIIFLLTTYYLMRPDYYEMWLSKNTSVRVEVAEQSVFEGNVRAQQAILDAIMSGQGTEQILSSFLRTAFSYPWASSYSKKDKEALYGVALSELLPRVPPAPSFSQLSPGALVVLVGALPVSKPQSWYKNVPVEYFHQLPAPYDKPFIVLRDQGIETLNNLSLRALCKILYGEISDETLAIYFDKTLLKNTYAARLDALLPFLSENAERTYEFLEKHTDAGKWITTSVINNWKSKPTLLKLQILAGRVPENRLSNEEVIDLLTLPGELRKSELFKAIISRLGDKSLLPTLAYLASQRNKLNRNQTISLILAFLVKGKQSDALIDAWFSLKPDRDAVVSLLLAQVQKQDDSINYFAIQAARYLDKKEWKPGVPELKSLSRHSEPLVRALAYSRLQKKAPEQYKILLEALKRENDSGLKKLLQEKLK